jgi:beta-glucosidase
MFSSHPRIAMALLTLLTPLALKGAPRAPADDPSAGAAQVQRLLAAMTLDEKIAIIHGATEAASSYQGQAGYLPGVPRLGIPPLFQPRWHWRRLSVATMHEPTAW